MWITKKQNLKVMSQCDIFCLDLEVFSAGTSCSGNRGGKALHLWDDVGFSGTAVASVCRRGGMCLQNGTSGGIYEVSSAGNCLIDLSFFTSYFFSWCTPVLG